MVPRATETVHSSMYPFAYSFSLFIMPTFFAKTCVGTGEKTDPVSAFLEILKCKVKLRGGSTVCTQVFREGVL
jgi:hypothetical protein